MKNPLSSFSKESGFHFSFEHLLLFWYHHYRKFFLLVTFIVIGFGIWNYYHYILAYHFTEDEKKQYIESYYKETLFQEKKFLSLVQSLESRKEDHQNVPVLKQNIFSNR
ncbi:MAG: hypothetical protein GW815_03820 [Candidatus Moranbacteria bacterium]|nr:hypothetical protein [Candidatus Moranbacteria bacterium]OIQ01974.1 MAG: hypothetical protein AUK58_03675 [Candidatus Moranbacteria bacterium CG2_30_41_165]PIP26062.1 MAG: hypothetical protein COX32_00040 [Candidatus Moranbacteria bacterium CG23_combo_of_CG06-09_8_20_14_all_41_28]PIV86004.1 MAG: hypothetical protein COW50_03845 [Candidatus Moranbacteria bacterium CG17_big_fil_post_rev_8_21_14_2_50_41_107]PIW94216.1 MAG: hypothetical protein COZ86_02195 [Candidatus Moranbacteria bacterium CG_